MQLMDQGTQLAFLWRLVAATQEGKVSWTSDMQSHFKTRIGRFGYTIVSRDSDDFAPYDFRIFKFELAADHDEDPLLIATWETAEHSPLNDALQSLYIEVSRRVLGYDSVVSDMFEDLAVADGGPATPTQTGSLPF